MVNGPRPGSLLIRKPGFRSLDDSFVTGEIKPVWDEQAKGQPAAVAALPQTPIHITYSVDGRITVVAAL